MQCIKLLNIYLLALLFFVCLPACLLFVLLTSLLKDPNISCLLAYLTQLFLQSLFGGTGCNSKLQDIYLLACLLSVFCLFARLPANLLFVLLTSFQKVLTISCLL